MPPIVARSHPAGIVIEPWCAGHGVPESVCTRCNPSLIPEFKAKNDWCAGHGLPESQCVPCNPEVEAYWAKLKPGAATPANTTTSAPLNATGITVEPRTDSLRPTNNPICDVESNQIRFIDATIAGKAGIRVEPVANRRIMSTVEAPAEVRYDPTRFARIAPRVPGTIVEAPAHLGDQIQVGDLLAVIESAELGTAKSAYVNAREGWILAKADLDRHHHIHDAVDTLVAACDEKTAVEEIRKRFADIRIGAHKGRILGALAQLELARLQFEREQSLLGSGITSKDAYQTAQRDLLQAETEFASAREEVEIELEREHLSFDRTLNMARISMDAASRQLQILGIDDGHITALNDGQTASLSRYELKSPIGGFVVERTAVVGESVGTDQALFAIADLSVLTLHISLDERDLLAVHRGDRVQFTSNALRGVPFDSTIEWISNEVDDRTRTVLARASMPNIQGLLRPNMFGAARIVSGDSDDLPTIPESALQTDGCCNLVFLQETLTLFRPKKVTLGAAASGFVQVRSGLVEGQTVVTDGSFLLKTEILKSSIGAGCCEVHPGR